MRVLFAGARNTVFTHLGSSSLASSYYLIRTNFASNSSRDLKQTKSSRLIRLMREVDKQQDA